MKLIRFSLLASALLGAALLSSACGTTIITGSSDCVVGDRTFEVGESFPSDDGCNTCTCEADDTISCTQRACVECEGPLPACDVGPPCSGGPVCRDGVWECNISCDDCEGAPPIDCIPPDNCFYDGPYCELGEWTCGELVCEGEPCREDPPLCEQPGDPNCYAEPICNEFGWECQVVCSNNCEDLFYDGYITSTRLIFQGCGCQAESPCLSSCANDLVCATGELELSEPCATCVQNEADMQNACVFDAVFGRECQNDPECASYIDCVLGGG